MAKGYIYDKLYNRKIEGESSFADETDVAELKGDTSNLEQRVDALEKVDEYDVTITSSLPSGVTESATGYKKCVVMGNVLWLVIDTSFNNGGEASADLGTINFEASVPSSIGKLIYKTDGYSIDEYVAGQGNRVTASVCLVGSSNRQCIVACYAKNKLTPYIPTAGAVSAGGNLTVSIRIPLILIERESE